MFFFFYYFWVSLYVHISTHSFVGKAKNIFFFSRKELELPFNKWEVSADRKFIHIFKKASLVLIVTAFFSFIYLSLMSLLQLKHRPGLCHDASLQRDLGYQIRSGLQLSLGYTGQGTDQCSARRSDCSLRRGSAFTKSWRCKGLHYLWLVHSCL